MDHVTLENLQPELDPADAQMDDVGETDFLGLLVVLAEHKKAILSSTVTAAVVAALLSLLLPNRYTATTKIMPPQRSQSLASALMGQLSALSPVAAMAGGSALGLKNPNDIYVGMLKSRTVEDALIHRFNLQKLYRDKRVSDTRKELEEYSEITTEKEGFIAISVEDKDPKRAADMANAYVEELRKLTQNLAVTEAGQRRLFFEQQLEQVKNNLADAEQALKETQQKTGLIQLDGQAKAIIESVVQLRAGIAAKEVQLRALRSFATAQNPDVEMLEQEVEGMKGQLATLEKQSGSSDGDVQIPTGKVPEAGLEYVRKLRDVKYYETIFGLLAKQYEAAKLDEARNAAVIQVMDPAVEPDRKSSPKRLFITVLSGFFAFLIATFYVLARARFIENLRDQSQATQFAKLKKHLGFAATTSAT